jgi:hypothetical protein
MRKTSAAVDYILTYEAIEAIQKIIASATASVA